MDMTAARLVLTSVVDKAIYTGLRQTPEMIVNAAYMAEDVQVIGLSICLGAHNAIVLLMELYSREIGDDDVRVIVGALMKTRSFFKKESLRK
jgi:methylmalonyl-CoA mutase cobalamin-binding domain/chain